MSDHLEGGKPGSVPRRDRFAWVALFFAAWITIGVALANWALGSGLANDIGFSPYHIPGYAGILALALVCAALVVGARRAGRPWRAAFPRGYGILGAGLLVLLAYPIVDLGWREGIGIGSLFGSGDDIENSLAPSRTLLPIGIILVAVGPLRAAIGSSDAPVHRWAAVISAGFVLGLLGFLSGSPSAPGWLGAAPGPKQGDGEVWVMDADGGHQTRLIEADATSSASWPAWSPDQTRIAYTRTTVDAHGAADLDVWVAAGDGSSPRPLVGGAGWQWIPSWSPDGTWIVFTREAAGGPDMAAGPQGPMTVGGLQGPGFAGGAPTPIRTHAEIWRVRADGTGAPQRLTDGQADDRAAAYSPDGTRLVFDSLRPGNTQIYVMNADGSNPVRLSQDAGEDWGATWSPDGKRVAFHSTVSGTQQVYIVAADGSDRTRLTNDGATDTEPTWSPDGSRIAFQQWDGVQGDIWSVAVDGSDPRDLSRNPGASAVAPAWGHDGRIAYERAADPTATSQPFVRNNLAAANMLLAALLVAIVALILVRTAPPFGAFAVVLAMAAALDATGTGAWPLVPAAAVEGLIVDILVRFSPTRRKANVAGAASAAAFVVGAAVTVAVTTGLGSSPTLVLGVAFATAAFAWGLAAVVGRQPDGAEGRAPA